MAGTPPAAIRMGDRGDEYEFGRSPIAGPAAPRWPPGGYDAEVHGAGTTPLRFTPKKGERAEIPLTVRREKYRATVHVQTEAQEFMQVGVEDFFPSLFPAKFGARLGNCVRTSSAPRSLQSNLSPSPPRPPRVYITCSHAHPVPPPPSPTTNTIKQQVQQLQQSVEFLTAELTASRDNLLRAENAARVTSEEKVDVAELESVQRAAQESVAVAKAEFAQKLERTKAAEATKAASKVALETARVQSETRDQVQRFNSEKEEETASLRAKLASMTDRILSKEAELKVGLCTSFECSWPIALETAWSQPSSL
jgi:hypothetical protein